jgi:hypothetical protein
MDRLDAHNEAPELITAPALTGDRLSLGLRDQGMPNDSRHEVGKQWVRAQRFGSELRVKLNRHKPGMILELDHLHELFIG